jgi:hypothetical protein
MYLGCTLGAGGAIALCYCDDDDDPTRCVHADSEFRNIESDWFLSDDCDCPF